MQQQDTEWKISSGVAWAILIGFAIVFPFVIIFISGWETATPDKTLNARVLSLETQVKELKQQIDSLNTKVNQIGVGPTATPTIGPTTISTPTYRLTPIPSDSVLVVVVPSGNVRAGPGMNYEIIGSVKAGDIIDKQLARTANRWYRFCCVDSRHGWLGPIVVEERDKGGNIIQAPTRIPTRVPTKPSEGDRQAPGPPSGLGVSSIYTKYLKADGAHIVALKNVSNKAIQQARDILYGMMWARPELLTTLTAEGLLIILFDGGTTTLSQLPEIKGWPWLSDGAYLYNGPSGFKHVIAVPEQRIRCNHLLTHEIGHAVEHVMDSEFGALLDVAYQKAKAKGNWIDSYAAINKHEYWAVSVGHWFHSEQSAAQLAKTDPEIARLIKGVFKEAKLLPYPCP